MKGQASPPSSARSSRTLTGFVTAAAETEPFGEPPDARFGAFADEGVELGVGGLVQEPLDLALGRHTAQLLLDPSHEQEEAEQQEGEQQYEESGHVAVDSASPKVGPP